MSLTKASYSMVRGAPVNVIDYISGGSGTDADPYVGWDTAITWAEYTEYYFPKGVFQHSVSLSLAYPGIVLRGSGSGTVLKFTGTSVCVRFDRSGLSGVNGIIMENFLIKGNPNATYGIFLTNCHRTTFRNITVVDVTQFGFDINFSVLGLIENFQCSVNISLAAFLPSIGLRIDASGPYAATYSTCQLIVNPVIEGISGVGILFDKCIFSKILNGTSEANGIGVQTTINSGSNVIDAIDCEANSVNDFVIGGFENTLRNAISGSAITTPVYISGTRTLIDGGHATGVENVGTNTDFVNFTLATGSLIDTGSNTQIRNLYSTPKLANIPKNENAANLLYNGSFEAWNAGTSVAPDGWSLSGAGAAIARNNVTVKQGLYSAAITRSGATAAFTQQGFVTEYGMPYLKGRQVVMGAWVWASTANTTRLTINTVASVAFSSFHSGNSDWEFLTVTLRVPDAATNVAPSVLIETTNTTSYVDAISLNFGGIPLPFFNRSVGSAGVTGGAGSAGAGKQYVSIVVDGITYKVLHDN
jgi:hypothetical protein